ncbi:MAG: hypothetical protein OSA40_03880 [Phycisphaerales bacterium]|nr:hypothetical protein [Phycisphaerales bacterium]
MVLRQAVSLVFVMVCTSGATSAPQASNGAEVEATKATSPPACCMPGGSLAARIAAGAVSGDLSQAPEPPGPELPGPEVSDPERPGSARIDPATLTLLDAMDAQSLSLQNFTARIRMDVYDDLADETEKRFGRVYLVMPPPAGPEPGPIQHRRAAIVFERSVEPSGRARERLEHFVLADGVLSDYDHEAKRLVRRRVVDPGARRDPLRLGEGPIPLPIGQRKADILKYFEVTPAPPIPPRVFKGAEDVVGMHLVPRLGSEMADARKITAIDLWVGKTDHLPIAVEVHERDGDRTSVRFFDPSINAGVTDEGRRWLDAPDVDPTVWRIESK